MERRIVIASSRYIGEAVADGKSFKATIDDLMSRFPEMEEFLSLMVDTVPGLEYEDEIEIQREDATPPELLYWVEPDMIVWTH